MPREQQTPMLLELGDFPSLFDVLRNRGYELIGPTIRDGAIVYDEIEEVADLPIGYGDEQAPGHYRLKHRGDQALFGYVVGPHAWKKYLFPPEVRLWSARKTGAAFQIDTTQEPAVPRAFIGVRPCELEAISIQDQVFMGETHVDPIYAARREKIAIIAVNCGCPAATCFCTSMGTGPRAEKGFDLALTEVVESTRHYFLMEAGSDLGRDLLGELPCRPAGADERKAAADVTEQAKARITRKLDRDGLQELLYANQENPRWEEIAERCLTCANCTMACPTCFCSTVEDTTDLTGEHAERWRRWDSCFTLEFSHIAGGSVRHSTRARYRQWLTHKLAGWVDQFGRSGCVGCGRCITWCPVGIDLTEEAAQVRENSLL